MQLQSIVNLFIKRHSHYVPNPSPKDQIQIFQQMKQGSHFYKTQKRDRHYSHIGDQIITVMETNRFE